MHGDADNENTEVHANLSPTLPDMAGCVDFDPAKTQRSMEWVQDLKARLKNKIERDEKAAIEAARARRLARVGGVA